MAADPIKVYDARWQVDDFNDDAVRRLFEATYAYGRQLGVDTVTLTRDARLGAGRVLEIATDTAVRMGLHTYLCAEPISTPHSYFTTLLISQAHPKTMGLTITASHNPREYIGVKFTVPTVQAIGLNCGPHGGLTRIREIYHSREPLAAVSPGTLTLVNTTREYIDFSMKQAFIRDGDLAGLRVVLDAFHGSSGSELFMTLDRAGVDVVPLRLIPDGNFPTGSPNPTSQGKMNHAVKIAGEKECQAVIGIDGDGDRIVFGDRRGILNAGFAFIPILRACGFDGSQSEHPPVLYDPKVNPLALNEWGKLNVRPVLFRNGHSQIKDYMRQIGSVAAAEESGHYYHRITMGNLTVACENSLLTILLFLGSVKKQPKLLDDLWALQNTVRTTGEFNYQFADDATRDKAMATVIRHFTDEGAGTVTATPDGIDLEGTVIGRGVTIDNRGVALTSGWYSGYLRIATNEKSVVRSYFSAADPAVCERVESEARKILAKDFHGNVID